MHVIENSGCVDDVCSSSPGRSLASRGLLMKKIKVKVLSPQYKIKYKITG